MLITWRVFAIFAFLTESSVHNNSRELQEKERYHIQIVPLLYQEWM